MATLPRLQTGLVNELSVDLQLDGKVKVQQMVRIHDPELLDRDGRGSRGFLSRAQSADSGRGSTITHLPGLARDKGFYYRWTLLLRVESFQLVITTFDCKAQMRQTERHG